MVLAKGFRKSYSERYRDAVVNWYLFFSALALLAVIVGLFILPFTLIVLAAFPAETLLIVLGYVLAAVALSYVLAVPSAIFIGKSKVEPPSLMSYVGGAGGYNDDTADSRMSSPGGSGFY